MCLLTCCGYPIPQSNLQTYPKPDKIDISRLVGFGRFHCFAAPQHLSHAGRNIPQGSVNNWSTRGEMRNVAGPKICQVVQRKNSKHNPLEEGVELKTKIAHTHIPRQSYEMVLHISQCNWFFPFFYFTFLVSWLLTVTRFKADAIACTTARERG